MPAFSAPILPARLGRRVAAALRGRRSERGQAIVEFTLALPLLLVIIFAIAEFGFMINDQISLTNAARDGARAGALKGGTAAAAQTQTTSSATGLIACSGLAPTATYSGGSNNQVTVTASCTYAPVTPLSPLIHMLGSTLHLPTTLSASTQMKVEQ